MAKERRAPTTDRIREDIDKGRSGEKVPFPDPAAAPLGTDDEAAGMPPGPDRRAAAAREEIHPERAHWSEQNVVARFDWRVALALTIVLIAIGAALMFAI